MQKQIANHLSQGRLAMETALYGWSTPAYSPAGGRLKPIQGPLLAPRRARKLWDLRWVVRRLAQVAGWARR